MEKDQIYKYNVYIFGESFVGKTNISTQAEQKLFEEKYNATIGIDFNSKTINYSNKTFRICIQDVSGQSMYRSIVFSYFRSAQGAILVYDITNRESFLKISEHLQLCKQRGKDDLVLILVGNKNDLEQNREVSYSEGQQFADEHNLTFLEVSAKTAYNIEELFIQMIQLIYNKANNELAQNEGGQLDISKKKQPFYSSKCY
ncbi:hypothetical protein ABPG74_007629 [Tetrahymena malaccensis]